jgi:hypothetical protein
MEATSGTLEPNVMPQLSRVVIGSGITPSEVGNLAEEAGRSV